MKKHLRLQGQSQPTERKARSLKLWNQNNVSDKDEDEDAIGQTMDLGTHGLSHKKKSSIWSLASRYNNAKVQPGPPPPPLPQIPVHFVGDYEAQLTPQYRAHLPTHVARHPAEVGNITTGPSRDDEDIIDPEDQNATEEQEEYDVKTLYEDDGFVVDFETFVSNLPPFAFDLPRATSPAPPSLSSQDDGNGSSISTVGWDDARHTRYCAPSNVLGEAHDYSTGPLVASHMAPKAVRPNAPSDLRISTSQHGTLTTDTDGESFPPLPQLCTEAGSPDTAPGPSTPRTAFNYTPLKQQYALFPPLRIGEDRTSSPGHRVDTNGDQDPSQAKGKNKRSSTRSGFSSLRRRSSSLKRRSKASLMSLFSGSG